MTATVLSKGQIEAANLSALLRARNPIFWIKTSEEARVEGFIAEAASAAGYTAVRVWDVAQGVTTLDGKKSDKGSPDPAATFDAIREAAENSETKAERGVWIMRDLPAWIGGQTGAKELRALRNLARMLPGAPRERAQAVIILTPSGEVPAELSGHATVIDWPLPDRSEIAAVLDAAVNALPEFELKDKKPDPTKPLRALACPAEVRDAAIDAAVGLSSEEAAACYAKSLVQTKRIDPKAVANEKKRVIAREKVLEWYDPLPGGLDAVGGLDALKSWLMERTNAYSAEARKYGLPLPKGVALIGVSGCGKSMAAKAFATAQGVPLLKLDLGALKSKFVGDSEGNLRRALKVIEALGRCVVWIDEVEKQLQGATSGSADGGVSADALGAILTWMQERKTPAFIVVTANDAAALPAEFWRKGRFDEVFWIDLPNPDERKAILKSSLITLNRGYVEIDLDAVSEACPDFTGAEVAELVRDALFTGFNDGAREIETRDLITAAKAVRPLFKLAGEKITAMRKWAVGRARPATTPMTAEAQSSARRIDI